MFSFKNDFGFELQDIGYNNNYNGDDIPPKISNHRSELVLWLIYWPASLIFTLLDNPLKHVVNFVISSLTKPMNLISAKMFKDFDEVKNE